jgi:hypothetical protein
LAIGGLVVAVGAFLSVSAFSGKSVPRRFVEVQSVELFDHRTTNGWFPMSGAVHIQTDDDSSEVLFFDGTVRRAGIARTANYQFIFGIALNKAASVEITPAPPVDGDSASRVIVIYDRVKGASIGTRATSSGEFVPAGPYAPIPDRLEGRSGYPELKITLTDGYWSATLNGVELGQVRETAAAKLPEIRLRADGGGAFLGVAAIDELRPAGPADELAGGSTRP